MIGATTSTKHHQSSLPGSLSFPLTVPTGRVPAAIRPSVKMLLTLLEKLPIGQTGKVFVGTCICLAICSYPVIRKRTYALFGLIAYTTSVSVHTRVVFSFVSTEQKAGHDLFSSERPQEIVDQQTIARREKLNIK